MIRPVYIHMFIFIYTIPLNYFALRQIHLYMSVTNGKFLDRCKSMSSLPALKGQEAGCFETGAAWCNDMLK